MGKGSADAGPEPREQAADPKRASPADAIGSEEMTALRKEVQRLEEENAVFAAAVEDPCLYPHATASS